MKKITRKTFRSRQKPKPSIDNGHKWFGKHLQVKVPKLTVSLVILFYLVLGVIAGLLLLDTMQDIKQNRGLASSGQQSAYLHIDAVKYGEKGQLPFEAPEGKVFLVATVTVKNNSDKTFYFAPVVQTYLTDSAKTHYPMSPAILDKPVDAGPIGPDEQVAGMLSYLVPQNAGGLVFHFVPEQENALPLQFVLP